MWSGVLLWRAVLGSRRCQASGEGEKELLELSAIGRCLGGTGILADDALLEAGRDDLESGTVQCARGCGELGQNIGAVAAILDHLDHATDLPLRAPKTFDHIREITTA